MIQIFSGKPRSGKTYRAVKLIQDDFIDFKSKNFQKYRYLYTNIGGFKFDFVNEILKDFPLLDAKQEDYNKLGCNLKNTKQ